MATAEKNKSGAGKFFLGAALGALAGAIAGRFVSLKAENDETKGCDRDEKCDCGGKCEHCQKKDAKIAELKAEKKEKTEKKPAEKPAEKKTETKAEK